MRHQDLSRRLCRRILAIPALLFGVLAWPAVGSAEPSCTIEPQNPTVDAGATVSWSANVEDIRRDRRTYAWSFEQGRPSASDRRAVEVQYPVAGTYPVSLEVTDGRRKRAVCTTTVRVNGGDDTDPPPPPSPIACSPIPSDAATAHSEECITAYTGPEVCVACHESQAREIHSSVHYQQHGATDYVTNIDGNAGEGPAGNGAPAVNSLIAVNTYCGTHESSPRFTCAGCHVGNGRWPKTPEQLESLNPAGQLAELANIDCMMCHQEVYKRYPNPDPETDGGFEPFELLNVALDENDLLVASPGSTVLRDGVEGLPVVSAQGDFLFVPADPNNDLLFDVATSRKMSISALEAAGAVHRTTRRSCLNCHAGAAGADGAKRGDLSSALVSPPTTLDHHMSPAGRNMTCADCHSAGAHRVRGRGLDLRVNDVPERFTCDSAGCHSSRPHGDYSTNEGGKRDTHAAKVACQTCHIPTYGKVIATEVARDWQDPHVSQTACNGRGGWLPNEMKGALNLVPSYAWFDGLSRVSYLGDDVRGIPTIPLVASIATPFKASAADSKFAISSVDNFDAGDPAYVIGAPSAIIDGSGALNMTLGVNNSNAKLYPMKEHWGKLARNDRTNTLVPHSTFEFFRTGDYDRAIEEGLTRASDMSTTDSVSVVPVHTFQTINHGVEPEDNALKCGACHASKSGGPVRLDLKGTLGYELRQSDSVVIGTNRSGPLNGDMDRICSQCHENKREKRDFDGVHAKHVADKKRDCASCHEFSRPERGLSLTKKD
ncbi:MAG: PKD domain-containing protein [Chromatiaceae bacterium]|jgi:hypothetical protein|nr:PKD domain-containing protein [Chromatiaceae bacterium]